MPTLEITTTIGCTLKCTFCPQDKLTEAYTDPTRALTPKNFKTILAKVPKHVRIDFSGMSEPWLNRHATDLLQHTLESGYHTAIYTTLQGMRDGGRVGAQLLHHKTQVETVVIHLPDSRGNMTGFRDSEIYQAALETFRSLKGHLPIHEMSMEPGWDLWDPLTRAGNLDRQKIGDQPIETTPHHERPLLCSFTPFYDHNVLLPNGDVTLCCMDYGTRHRLGNLLTDDYYDLFKSEGLNDLRTRNMKYGHDPQSLCKSCSRAKTLDLNPSYKQFWEDPPPA